MRPATRLFLAFSALILICVGVLVWMHVRNLRESWTGEQLKRCASLGSLVQQYHERHGTYPKTLRELVDKRLLTEKEYGKLKFQTGPWSESLEWQYHAPVESHDAILFSGQPVVPQRGGEGMYFFGWHGGMTQGIGQEKLAWFLKRPGMEWIRR